MEFGLGVLRLSPEAFWSMTPREMEAAYEGYRKREHERQLLDDLRFGELAVLLIEPHRDPKKRTEPYHPEDFFPALKEIFPDRATRRAAVQQQTPEQMRAVMIAHTAGIAKKLGLTLADAGLEELM